MYWNWMIDILWCLVNFFFQFDINNWSSAGLLGVACCFQWVIFVWEFLFFSLYWLVMHFVKNKLVVWLMAIDDSLIVMHQFHWYLWSFNWFVVQLVGNSVWFEFKWILFVTVNFWCFINIFISLFYYYYYYSCLLKG